MLKVGLSEIARHGIRVRRDNGWAVARQRRDDVSTADGRSALRS
jgi:hypothetical protein